MSDVRRCKPQFMEIPLDEKKLGNTKWLKGKCFTGMGKMYLNYFGLEWKVIRCYKDEELPKTFWVKNFEVTFLGE